MEPYQNCDDFSSWVPSVMLAGMLALFQGREAPVPRRYVAKVRLIASCVLITSAFLLFNDKDVSFSPRKLNALMVFGFVLNYYFGPKSFGVVGGIDSYRSPDDGVPAGAAYFSLPKDYDMRRNHVSKGTDRLPEGWGMQVDGGDYYKGTRKIYRGRSKIPKRTHEIKRRYVAEELGEWSSAEESFNKLQHRKGACRDKYDFHVPQQLARKNQYSDVLPSQPANNLKNKGSPKKKGPAGTPVINYSKDKEKEDDDKGAVEKGRKSLAIVTDLTNQGSNNVFKINPMEEQHMKMAATPLDSEKKVFKHPTCFQINPLKIAGINDQSEEAEESVERARTVPGSPSVVSRRVAGSLPRSTSVYPVITERKEDRRRHLRNLTSKPARMPERMVSGMSLRSPYKTPPAEAEDDAVPVEVGMTYPEGNDAYWDRERIRNYIARNRRERRRRRNFPAKIPELELKKRREAERREAERREAEKRARKRERLERELDERGRLEREANDPWAYAFDGTVAGEIRSPFHISTRALSRFVIEWKTPLFLLMVALSHLGYFVMTTNNAKLASMVGNWSQQAKATGKPAVAGQTLITIPLSPSIDSAEAGEVAEGTIANNPVFAGYMEAFLLFCLVKGSVDCVDKIFLS